MVERDAPDRVVPAERDVPTRRGDRPDTNDIVNEDALGTLSAADVATGDAGGPGSHDRRESLPASVVALGVGGLVAAVVAAGLALVVRRT